MNVNIFFHSGSLSYFVVLFWGFLTAWKYPIWR